MDHEASAGDTAPGPGEYPPLVDDARSRRFSATYSRVVTRMDADFLAPVRRELVGPLTGTIVEIGAGTGSNVPHYSPRARVELLEPFASMRSELDAAVADAGRQDTMTTSPARAEQLPHRDHSVDAVVSTLVLCSVVDPERVLSEIRRVLRPGGTLAFVEHTRGSGMRHGVQRLLEPLQRRLAGNCHLTRDMPGLLDGAGFDTIELGRLGADRVPWPYRLSPPAPFITGRATTAA